MYPPERIAKVVKIKNHPRHEIDFILSGLDTPLYLNDKV
jgi:hypothetical protein